MEERGSGPVRIPMKRSATVPAQPQSSQECTDQGPLVQQEQAMEASSELHVSSSHTSMHKGYSQMTSTPRRENDSHSQTSGLSNQELQLDVNLGKHNPKLSFILYPCGQFQDTGKAVTMAVRIAISEKCPPLPPASKLHLALVMWDGEREGNSRKVEEKLNTTMFYIYNLIDHDQLKLSRSKNFHLDFIEVSCSGVQDCYSYV